MDASLNIVELIENNPITKLSCDYNNRFINKIKENFTETQQQLFVSSFYCYLNYNQTNDFVIDLDNIWKWLGFSQKAMAKRLLENSFVINKDYKSLLCRSAEQKTETRGGHNKETILLTIRTFKLFCIKSGTEKANEIHEYFVRLEDIMNQIVQEECIELKRQLEETNKNFDKKLLTEKALQKQDILLKRYGYNSSLVYIVKVKTYKNGEYVIKIGESRKSLENRFKEHKKNYEESLLLDCFSVNKSQQFEHFLHHHDKIRPNKVKNLTGHENENELFLIGKNLTYDMVLKIITDNINKFNEWTVNDILDIIHEENQKFLDKLVNVNIPINATVSNNQNDIIQTLLHKIENLEKSNKEILEKIDKPQIKTATNFNTELVTLGDRLQKINPETGTLVKVYESAAECINESKKTINRQALKNAINYNTVYRGFRWMFVDRNKDPNIIENYQPTKVTRPQNLGYIAKLDADKTKIINVYLDRKTAAKENGYNSSSALDNPVKNGTVTNGNYYILYDNCEDDLRENFEEEYGEPILYKDGVGQFDSNNNLLQEFTCKDKCGALLKISEKSLRRAIENNIMYNNYYYRKLGSKIKVVDE
jgi:phage anti-repressor protein